jgi:pSer/pThr/pTyr-binding forkhead associated (FHA) protein
MSGYLELPDGACIVVRDGLVLGRVAACDVVVDDSKASRRHARLIAEAGVVEIEDMKSSNGTLLNGKPVDRRMIRDGDEVRIGKTAIIYREGPLPGGSSGTSSNRGPAKPALFDDDDDLFGGDDVSSTPSVAEPFDQKHKVEPSAPVRPATPSSPTSSKANDDDLLGDDLLGDDLLGGDTPSSSAPPPSPPQRSANVVEFEDEVVEMQHAPAPSRDPEPLIEVRKPQRSDSPSAKTAPRRDATDEVVGKSQRVLQFSKKASGQSPLGDDLAQMSGGMRLLVVFAAIAIGGGIIYGITTAMQ